MPRRYKKYRPHKGAEVYGRLNKDSVRSADNLPQPVYRRSNHSDIPSKGLDALKGDGSETAKNSMVEKVRRGLIVGKEAEEIARKAKCLAPAYNKGAYQYITSEDAAKAAGHKGAGEGER